MRSLVGAAGVVMLLVGCRQPCYQLCEVRADAFGECLEPWYLSWTAFEVDSRDEYVEVCRAATDAERTHLSRVARSELDEACETVIDAHESAADCDAQWEVFEESVDLVP